MNILALTSSYPRYDSDPTAPFIESITKNVAELGHTVHVVLPAHRDWRRPPIEGAVHYHTYRYTPLRSWTPWGYSESLAEGVRIRKPLYALAPIVTAAGLHTARRVLRGGRFDLVHVHWVIPNGPLGVLSARAAGLPVVVSLHGSDISVSERIGALGRVARWTFERAAAVTAPSEDLLTRAGRLGARRDLEVISYGADVVALHADAARARQLRAQLDVDEDALLVAGIGRFVHWKGFDYLLDAVATASSEAPDLRLLFVGDGDLRDHLERRSASLGLGGRVTFAGMVERDEMPAYLAATDIVAVPSVHYNGYVDGLPNVALEAMAAGKALVATDVGGLPQLVRDGENGLLVPEKDARALADALVRLALDRTLRTKLGAAAQEEIRTRRGWDAVARQFVEVYARAVGAR